MIRITANFVSGKSFASDDNDYFDFRDSNKNNHLFDKLEKIMMEKLIKHQEKFVNGMENYFSSKPKSIQDIMDEYGKIISFEIWDLKNNMKTHITGYDVFAVENKSGLRPIFFQDSLVYVVKNSSNFDVIGELDGNQEHICDEKNCNLNDCSNDLLYAVSLKDLVNEAISSGLLQKLAKKTRLVK